MKVLSSGGVIINNNLILLLKKYNGDYVLPKGRIERGESIEEAALREVKEESGITGEIKKYLGKIEYSFINKMKNVKVDKTVHFFLMSTKDTHTIPQSMEGFKTAKFYDRNEAIRLMKYSQERSIIRKAIEEYDREKNEE
ncbi:NUDIX hydrolase [Fenollaria sporofastidiosus]|uniref:NUDIX hydrolase n=1 Tax=Fenollaria sporofastidiosus TaxID=2811778 RepID=UPI001C004C6C|nr:NUDIX domain-containing protein [Fenollaria sporofastidiosus]